MKFFFEYVTEANGGVRPPEGIRKRFGRKIKDAIEDRQPPEVIRATIVRCVDDALSPASFEEVMWKVQRELATGDTQGDRDLVRRFMEANGGKWPTGSRFVRGTISGTFKPDVLGFDKCPYSVPWGKPDREDVLAALKALDARGDDITAPGVRDPRKTA